jgi:hypothetical protein
MGGANGTRYWLNLEFTSLSHYNILTSPPLQALINNILLGTSDPTPDISVTEPTSVFSNRLHFTLHSPLTLGFIDSNGKYTGSTATTTLFNIPSVNFERYGDVQWLSIPSNLEGHLVMKGTANGSFTLDVEQTTNGLVTATSSFEGVPSATSTVVTMTITPNQSVVSNGILVIDFNGDGVKDSTLYSRLGQSINPMLYKWDGFLQPINDSTSIPNQPLSVFKAGSTVPVKFQLKTLSGNLVQASTSPIWITPQRGTAMSTPIGEFEYTDPGTVGNVFKWDNATKQYIFNWSTKGLSAGYWYKILVKLDDGSEHSIVVGLR